MSAVRLADFFARYAEISHGPQPEALAAMYAPHFIVGGPRGSMSLANDDKFLEWLRGISAFNQQHGMRSLEVVALREQVLSPIHRLATVSWGARFEKTGSRLIEFDISYLVEQCGDDWRILSYVSERDQEDEMKAVGLL
jgi:hypothetical protein